ncbi:MAG TPA: DNA-3-methyladenine glycosylase [Actinomycetes bacterium]|nr:DNA-3-methyladenine glycosylase [Actinomycetes bacterium]
MDAEASRSLLSKPPSEVALCLLGGLLTHQSADGAVSVRLTEVESYGGKSDPASHAYRGRTPRNESMFAPAGTLYVYRSHGIHWCCNVVTGSSDDPSAVLLRAGQVVDGLDVARTRRGARVSDRHLARGPGCLGQALGLTETDDGTDLLTSGGVTLLVPEHPVAAKDVRRGPRVGVSKASELEWRFWLADEPTVSAYRKSPRA